MTRLPSFRDLLGLTPDLPSGGRSISFDPSDASLRVTGYSPAEVSDFLAVYRDHVREFTTLMAALPTPPSADAVRYRPTTPEDIMGEEGS